MRVRQHRFWGGKAMEGVPPPSSVPPGMPLSASRRRWSPGMTCTGEGVCGEVEESRSLWPALCAGSRGDRQGGTRNPEPWARQEHRGGTLQSVLLAVPAEKALESRRH